ncbi:MAG: hypothetical protein KA154_10485, partial [Gemmatimonadaceae bacterium]|nr:hypothetical protein [Gemmatimonadaceae bacterium]
LAKLDAWMPRMESLPSLRRSGGRMSWEPRPDPLGNFLRSFGMGGRKLDLVRLDQVVASVSAIDGERTLVRFDADAFKARRTQRTTILSVAFAMTVIGAGFAVPLTLLAGSGVVAGGIAALVAMAGGATLLSWRAIRRGYREMIDRTHLRLEQLLDELEQGGMQPPPSLARQVTQALLR